VIHLVLHETSISRFGEGRGRVRLRKSLGKQGGQVGGGEGCISMKTFLKVFFFPNIFLRVCSRKYIGFFS